PRHRPPAIGDLEDLAPRDPFEVAAGVLPQLPDSNPLHVLQSSTLLPRAPESSPPPAAVVATSPLWAAEGGCYYGGRVNPPSYLFGKRVAMAVQGIDLGKYKLGWSDSTEQYVYTPKKGLNEDIVREISHQKSEPEWMTKFRLNALKRFERKPM